MWLKDGQCVKIRKRSPLLPPIPESENDEPGTASETESDTSEGELDPVIRALKDVKNNKAASLVAALLKKVILAHCVRTLLSLLV
jgi:hypothetical protein